MCKIIAVANPKGGVGKTTTAVNLATGLAIAGKKTLLIDMDPSASCSVSLGFYGENIHGDIFSLLGFTKSINNSIHKTSIENLDLIPAHIASYEYEEKIDRFTYNMFLFKNILRSIIDDYNYIILDTPPYVKGMSSIALATADSVLIPITCGHFSLTALKKLLTFINFVRIKWNQNLTLEGILFSMYEPNTRTWALTEDKLFNSLGKYIMHTAIPKNTIIAESTYFGKPVILYEARSKGAAAFLNLSSEIIIKNKKCPIMNLVNEVKAVYQYTVENTQELVESL